MKRLYLLLILFVVATFSMAINRTGVIPTGATMLSRDMTMTAADSINEDETVVFTITNLQKYAQLQVFTVTLDNISGTTDVAITAYGKVTTASSYVQIGSPVTLSSDGTATITATTPINYNYLKVELVAGSGDQHSHITSFIVKTSNAYDIPANSGTLTVSRADAGTVTITSADNNADAALTVSAGGTGALTVGDSGSTTAITSSDWAIGATGVATGLGAITSDGLVKTTGGFMGTYNFASATAVAGTGDAITMDFTPDFPTLAVGLSITFVAEAANTTATTLNIDGVGAKDVKKYGGAIAALIANDIRSGQVCTIVYDGTQWVLMSPKGN